MKPMLWGCIFFFFSRFFVEGVFCFSQNIEFNQVFHETNNYIIHQDEGLSGVLGEIACSEKGEMIIVDIGSKRVLFFDTTGKRRMDIGKIGRGPGEFLQPIGLCVDRKDNIYVSDNLGRKVIKYDSNGKYLSFFYFAADHWIPRKMQTCGDTNLISFSPQFQPPSAFIYKNIQVYGSKGRFIRSFFETSKKILDRKTPEVMPVGILNEDGKIYACLDREFKIYCFDLEGKLINEFGDLPSHFKEFEGFKKESDAIEFLKTPYEKKKDFYENYSRIDNIIIYAGCVIVSSESFEKKNDESEKVFYLDIFDLKSNKRVFPSIKTKYRMLCANKKRISFLMEEKEFDKGTSLKIGFFNLMRW